MEDFRILLSQTPNPPPGTRRHLRCNMAATTPSQVGTPRSHSWPNVTQHIGHENSNPIHISFMHFLQYTAFTFLLCVLGPKANNLWHILSLDTLKNVDTSNRDWSVGEKLNLKPKLIEVSQNLTLLEETLLWLSIYSTEKVQRNMF